MNYLNSLCTEAAQGNLVVVKDLLESNPDLVSSKQDDDNTPLHLAAENGHKDVIKVLLSRGTRIDAVNKCRNTSLYMAVLNGHKDVVEVLLANGAPVYDGPHLQIWYLCTAAEKGHKAVVEVLLQKTLNVLADANENIVTRRCAAHALGACGDVRAVETLCKLFEGADKDLQFEAARALGKLGNSVDLPRKIFFCEEMSIQSRIAALNALHTLGQYCTSQDYRPRFHKYRTPDAISYCRKMVSKADTKSRETATEMLRFLTYMRSGESDPSHLLIPSVSQPDSVADEQLLKSVPVNPDTEPISGSSPSKVTWWKRILGS